MNFNAVRHDCWKTINVDYDIAFAEKHREFEHSQLFFWTRLVNSWLRAHDAESSDVDSLTFLNSQSKKIFGTVKFSF